MKRPLIWGIAVFSLAMAGVTLRGQQAPKTTSHAGPVVHGTRWIDVTHARFGASPGASPRENRIAIQAAIDSVTDGSAATVYIPSGTYRLDRPIFLDTNYISLRGEGMRRTILQFATDGVVAGIKRKIKGHNVSADHFPDLYAAGPRGGPLLDSTAVSGPGKKWAFRTKGDAHLVSIAGAFDTGLDFDWYAKSRKLTVDFAVDLTRAAAGYQQGGCLLGVSERGEPSPWSIQFGSGQIKVLFGTANPSAGPLGATKRIFYFGDFARNPGLARVTVQIDLAKATVAAWINGSQQKLGNVNLGKDFTPEANLHFVSNQIAPFTLGANSGLASVVADAGGTAIDVTFGGAKVSAEAIYAVGPPGSAQTRVDGAPITDHNRYFAVKPTTIGTLPLAEPPAAIQADRVMTLLRGSAQTAAYVLDNEGHSGMTSFNVPGDVRDLSIRCNGHTGTAYVNGWCYACSIRDCELLGGTRGFGSLNCGANYPIEIRNCFVGGIDAPFYFFESFNILITRITTATAHRCTIRSVYSNPIMKDSFITSGGGQPEFLVESIGGGFMLENVNWNNESLPFGGGTKAAFYASPWRNNPLDGIIKLTNVCPGRLLPGAPVFYLDDIAQADGHGYGPATFHVDNFQMYDSGARTIVKTTGTRWQGEIKAHGLLRRPTWLDNTGPNGVGSIVARHPYFTGTPRDGTWQRGNVLDVTGPSVGQYTQWQLLTPGSYGTAEPPVWQGFNPLDDGRSLAAYIADHSYWRAEGGPADAQGFWSNAVHAMSLNALFGGPTPQAPGPLFAGLGVYRAARDNNPPFELPKGNGYARVPVSFTPSKGGEASNAKPIAFGPATAPWTTDPNPVGHPNALMIFDSHGHHLASVDIATAKAGKGASLTIPAGAVRLAPAASSGQGTFSTAVHDLISNSWLGGEPIAAPRIHLALSTSPADVNAAPVEPKGGSYARVATTKASWRPVPTASWTVPGSVGDACVIRNAEKLAFPAPTDDWGTVRSVYLMDAPTGGKVLAAANLTLPRSIAKGSLARAFAVGALWICRS